MFKRIKITIVMLLRNKSSGVTLWLVSSQFLAAGAAFLVNLLAANAMTPEGRGLLALFLQIGYLISVVAMFGVECPFVARMSTDFRNSVTGLHVLTRAGTWIMLAPAAVGAWFWFSGKYELAICCAILVFFAISNVHVRIIRSAYISSREWRPFVGNSMIMQIILLFSAATLVFVESQNVYTWLIAYTVSSGLSTILVLRSVSSSEGKKFIRSSDFSSVRRQGLKLFPASLGNTAMLRSDRLLLPFLAGPAELGFYVVVATSMDMAAWPVQQWVDSKLNQWRTDKVRRTKLMASLLIIRVGGMVGVLAFVVGILVWYIIDNYLPDDYSPARRLLVPLGIAVVVYAMTRVQQGLMLARSWAGGVSIAETLGMAFSVVAYVALIPLFGSLGAAVGSVAGYSVCLIAGALVWRANEKKELS